MSWKYPLAMSSWNDDEIEAIQEVIRTGHYTMGPKVAAYEKAFADQFGSKYSVMCSSGSTANLLMVAALFFRKNNPLRRGDTVVVPAVSWSTTYFPLTQYGLKLRFVDVDPLTLNYDLGALETAMADCPRLLMVVNLLGNPNDFVEIKKILGDRPIDMIEDNCESMGATFNGQACGTFGVMGSYSSFFSHHISTMEGGSVVTDDEELYHILLCLRAHGWTRNLPEENHVTGKKSPDPFEESFKFVLPGYNVRPLEMSGAIGLEQLKKLPRFVQHRRENASWFKDAMAGVPGLQIQKEIGVSSWFGFSILVDREVGIDRRTIVGRLQSKGVECRPIVAGDFTKNPVVKWIDHEIWGEMTGAGWIDRSGFFVGNHHMPMKDDIQTMVSVLRSVLP